MSRRGTTLIQLLVGVIVVALVMAGFLRAFANAWRMQLTSIAVPGLQRDAKDVAMKIADAARGATLCAATDSGCTVDAPAENASSSAITLYRRNDDGTMTKRTYAVGAGLFTIQIGSAGAATICNSATLTLNFYGAASYNASTLTPFVPTNSTLKTLAAIGIKASVARNGITESYSTLIRLRNSPKPQ